MNPRSRWGQPSVGWGQPQLPGWAPLVDDGPLPLRAAGSVARWWWPTVTVAGFLAVVVYVVGHDHPTPGLSHRGLATIALAALTVVVATLRRAAGPGPLVRALAEYTIVALLASLLTLTGAVDQQPATPGAPATKAEADQAATATPDPTKPKPEAKAKAEAADDRPGVVRVASRVLRAVTGAAGWLADLWRQADQQTTPPESEAKAAWDLSPSLSVPSSWRRP